jgi:phosphopantetheinyl transferase
MIGAMAAMSLWTSPGGKTSHATLYSAIVSEIALKGQEARFVKTEQGEPCCTKRSFFDASHSRRLV